MFGITGAIGGIILIIDPDYFGQEGLIGFIGLVVLIVIFGICYPYYMNQNKEDVELKAQNDKKIKRMRTGKSTRMHLEWHRPYR